jgi:poly(A) polymerase
MNDYRKAAKICYKLQRRGFQAVFTGGWVRDSLLGLPSSDIDIATNATPDKVEKLFRRTKAVGKSFGVILVKMKDTDFEVATFRIDGTYSDGRHPDGVQFTSMEEDAKRRDFTVNAMFYDPRKNKYIDFVDGQKDLAAKRIRFVGDPNQRIVEDNLRMLRAIRFALKLNSWIEPESMQAIRVNASKITNVSSERVREEFMKMIELGCPKKMINLLFDSNLIDYILPEIKPMKGNKQNPFWHPEGDVLEHTILVMQGLIGESSLLQLAALFHDIGKPSTAKVEGEDPTRISNHGHDDVGAKMTFDIMTRLKFSNDEINYVVNLVSEHMKHQAAKDMKKSTLKRFMAQPYFDDLIKLNYADVGSASGDFSTIEFLEEKKKNWTPEEIKPKTSLVTGDDLIAMGLKPGPEFKKLLTLVMDAQLEGTVKDKEQGLKLIERTLWINGER